MKIIQKHFFMYIYNINSTFQVFMTNPLAALKIWTMECCALDMESPMMDKNIGWWKIPGTPFGETKDISKWLVTRTICVASLHLLLILKFKKEKKTLLNNNTTYLFADFIIAFLLIPYMRLGNDSILDEIYFFRDWKIVLCLKIFP